MKKILTLICTLLCANVLLAQPTVGDILIREGVKYRIISENEAEVYGPVDDRSSIDILSIVTWHYEVPGQGIWDEEYIVTSIGHDAFSERPQITSVNIPNSIISIGVSAFSYCGFTSITIPNSVTSIGDGAFSNCSSLTSFTIPNSVTSIGDAVFAGCTGLTSVTLPESITSIGSGAFNGCSFLQNVTCLATTPPTLGDNTVFPYPNIATLTVPCGTLEAYSAPTSFWNMLFMGRIEEDCEDNSGLEDAEETLLSFFPNPTKDKITFSQAIEKIEVIDLTGKAILTFTNAKTINIESLPSGAYYLRLTNEEKTSLQKVIKQ